MAIWNRCAICGRAIQVGELLCYEVKNWRGDPIGVDTICRDCLVPENAPTLTSPNEWVSVEEKTPKGNASILIYENGDIAIATFKDEKFMEYSDTGYPVLIRRPTHWTPLPEPPEEYE